MSNYKGTARFLEIGIDGQPFRSTINIEHIIGVRYEPKVEMSDPQVDEDGIIIGPPAQWISGWNVVITTAHGGGQQTLTFDTEEQAIDQYTSILAKIRNAGVPTFLMAVPQPQPVPEPESANGELDVEVDLLGPNGESLSDLVDTTPLPGEVPLTDEEVAQLESPEVDVDAIADAIEQGLGVEEGEPEEPKQA